MNNREVNKVDEWERDRVLSGNTGPFGSVSDIPSEVWGDGEFDSKSAAETVILIDNHRRERLYKLGIPGVKPPDSLQ